MNSEELEVSLRSEFENYLKNVFAEMRQEISQLQQKIEGELDNHRAQLDSVFKDAMSRVEGEHDFDPGFSESVVEHLRLAKDEGARITATAMAEAEDMEKRNRAEADAALSAKAGVRELHQAINDISAKTSQSEILKTLVQHAGQFTPRGAFFIVKNEHFVGWRTFGSKNGDGSDQAVISEVYMPVSSDSIMGEAYRSLATVESSAGTYADDEGILNKLGFDASSEKMYAIPLVVRGRAVALLYADYGSEESVSGDEVSVEALETMVRVASLTVEILASAKGASKESRRKAARSYAGEGLAPVVEAKEKESSQPEYASSASGYNNSARVENSYQSSFDSDSYAQQPAYQEPAALPEQENYSSFEDYSVNQAAAEPAQAEQSYSYDQQSWSEVPAESVTEVKEESYSDNYDANQYAAQDYSTEAKTADYSKEFSYQPAPSMEDADPTNQTTGNYQFDYQPGNFASPPVEEPKTDNFESFSAPESPSENYSATTEETGFSYQAAEASPQVETNYVAPPVEEVITTQPSVQPETTSVSAPPVRSRFSERNVDLPIEVSEDERRLHNDARRFARLLVSEIKLYNEQKVKEGRDAADLYDRLREAIDRSREMYDKRVQPAVAEKFDYFHYELINSLAEGDANKLGKDYPGSTI